MASTFSNQEVKTWLLSMVGQIIDVVIIQKAFAETPQHVLWKGKGKVIRCVQEGVVLELNAGGASWWSRVWGHLGVQHVVERWTQKPISVPYDDVTIDLNPTTGAKWLVIDAATWKRSPEELTKKK
ncbi:MAG: hypothetical protein OEZ05_10850 [Nitrospirota bacterium]|nr:hypothetical protein [Nitrospirota bacterium]MDH5587117.1 hypothetical protein [Nitrospirota bacterium]